MRPVFGAGDQFMQIGEHLTAVADAQPEAVVAGKKGGELITRTGIEQYRFGPAFAGAEHVTVRKTAAGRQPVEGSKGNAAADNIAHMHIDRSKTGALERCRHFDLTVDTLFAQNRDPGACTAGDQ
jgi:hypothetical protein